jgi:type I restriction enzyme M protein
MEACIIICRTSKRHGRRGQILLINAVNDVTRKNAFSYLEDAHVKRIADAYEGYADIDGFSKVITIADTAKNAYSLSISLYVREVINEELIDSRTVAECATAWKEAAFDMRTAYEDLKSHLSVESRIYQLAQPELLMVAEESNTYKADDQDTDEGDNADEG